MPPDDIERVGGAQLPDTLDHNGTSGNQSDTVASNDAQAHDNFTQLRSEDQARILRAILQLREVLGDKDVNIPQIVVCGDQSSGKSSVLEAIAGIAFPIGVDTTTRFATEIVLRSSETIPLDYKLIASSERSGDSKNKVEEFRMPVHPSGPQDFGRVIEAAGRHLEVLEPNRRFWNDWLRVEMTGPGLPHLTLIDLPGIIQSVDGANALRGDKAKISDLVCSYLRNTRTTILAVFNGMNDVANQEILSLVREARAGNRTLGVITRPDIVPDGSDLQKKVMNLARNETTGLRLGLGWHVLKNLPHDDIARSQTTRDSSEKDFFSRGRWNQVNRSDVGIDNLRKKLVREQFKKIGDELPQLTNELREKVRELESKRDRLGMGRETKREQQVYLSKVLEQLHRLIHASLQGEYEEVEFLEFFDGNWSKCLRDRVRTETDEFALKMRTHGQQYHIFHDQDDVHEVRRSRDELDKLENLDDLNFFYPYRPSSTADGGNQVTLNVPMRVYCEALSRYMQGNRGTLLPGNWSSKTVRAIFRQQSVPWTNIAHQFGDSCYDIAYSFMRQAITYVAGQHTGESLMRRLVNTKFEETQTSFKDKIDEILWPFKESHPMTYNPKFKQGRQNIRDTSSGSDGEEEASTVAISSFGDIARTNNFNGNMISAANAMDEAEAYYDIALDNFIDNIAIYAVERCLLSKLTEFIPPSIVHDMNEQTISDVAAECQEDRDEREKTDNEVQALHNAIRVFQRAVRDQEAHRGQNVPSAGQIGNTTRASVNNTTRSEVVVHSETAAPAATTSEALTPAPPSPGIRAQAVPESGTTSSSFLNVESTSTGGSPNQRNRNATAATPTRATSRSPSTGGVFGAPAQNQTFRTYDFGSGRVVPAAQSTSTVAPTSQAASSVFAQAPPEAEYTGGNIFTSYFNNQPSSQAATTGHSGNLFSGGSSGSQAATIDTSRSAFGSARSTSQAPQPADNPATHRRSPSPLASDQSSSQVATRSVFDRDGSPYRPGNNQSYSQVPFTAFRSGKSNLDTPPWSDPRRTGTAGREFSPWEEFERKGGSLQRYQSLPFRFEFDGSSFEEHRLADYEARNKDRMSGS